MTEVGEIIGRARYKAGLTQDALAGRAGLSKSTIQNVEKGKTKPAGNTLWAIARALDYGSWEELRREVMPARVSGLTTY